MRAVITADIAQAADVPQVEIAIHNILGFLEMGPESTEEAAVSQQKIITERDYTSAPATSIFYPHKKAGEYVSK